MNEDDRGASPPIDHDVSATKKRGRRPPEPLKVRVELVVVAGEAGREFMQRQAAAVREALQWFADNPPATFSDAEGAGSSSARGLAAVKDQHP